MSRKEALSRRPIPNTIRFRSRRAREKWGRSAYVTHRRYTANLPRIPDEARGYAGERGHCEGVAQRVAHSDGLISHAHHAKIRRRLVREQLFLEVQSFNSPVQVEHLTIGVG